MPTYQNCALIDLSDNKVIDIIVIPDTIAGVPENPNGFRYIPAATWAEGQIPKVGDIWDQNPLSANFTTPTPTIDVDLSTLGIEELQALNRQKRDQFVAEQEAIEEAIQAKL